MARADGPDRLVGGWRPVGWPGDRIAIGMAGLGLGALAFLQRNQHQQQDMLEAMRTRALILGIPVPAEGDYDLRLCLVGVLHGE